MAQYLKIDQFSVSDTWLCPAGVTSILVECWGAGGGGQAGVGGGGGGAYARSTVAVTPGNNYAVVVGVGADNTNGTSSSFNSTTVVATGGLSASNGGTGATTGASTGDTKYGGANGSLGTGNRSGGGGAGDSATATTSDGGSKNGGFGTSTIGSDGRVMAGGGGSTDATQGAGARGEVRLTYLVDTPFSDTPYVVGRSWGRSTVPVTSLAVTMPASIDAGDKLVIIVGGDGIPDITIGSGGWTRETIVSSGAVTTMAIFTKTAAGGDTATLSYDTLSESSYIVYRIKNVHAITYSTTSGNSSNANPPNHTPSTGSKKYLWLAGAVLDCDSGNFTVTSPPSGMDSFLIQPSNSFDGTFVMSAERYSESASYNPLSFSNPTEAWVTITMAIEPPPHQINVNDTVAISEDVDNSSPFFLPTKVSVIEGVNVYENVSLIQLPEGIQVFIGNTNVTKSLQKDSLGIESVLTHQVDRCKFVLQKYGSRHTYIPRVGQEVTVYDSGQKIFGGVLVKVVQGAEDYKVIQFDVECEDYTRYLDKRLVAEVFENQTISEIIERLVDSYLDGFTTSNVIPVTKVLTTISFNYIPVSDCLKQLANIMNYDWYVDYDKDIHFFAKDTSSAPFDIQDDDGSYIFSSLRIRRDNSQIRNRIFVRGGEYLADTFTTEYISDGVQNVYGLPYKYQNLQVSVTGEIWSQGIDGLDPLTLYDYIWNKNEKFVRFRGDRIPNDTSSIRVSGAPYLPVRVVIQDDVSIDSLATGEDDGVYEYLIIDDSISSKNEARERAQAELESYKDTLSEGSFRTYTRGLRVGQRIRINSSAHGIDEYFIINKVSSRMWSVQGLEYDISIVTTKTFGIIEFLQSLILKETKDVEISESEILDTVYSKPETVTISEEITVQELDTVFEYVAGPWTDVTGIKRQFVTSGSPLGPNGWIGKSEDIQVVESINISIS